MADLKGLHAGLDDRGKDRFALMRVCKHVRDLVQEAGEETETIMLYILFCLKIRTQLESCSVNMSIIRLIQLHRTWR